MKKFLNFIIPIVPPVMYPDESGDFAPEDTIVPLPEEDFYFPILSEFGDFLAGITNGVAEIVDFATSAFEGALSILGYIKDFIPTFDFFDNVLPGSVSSMVSVIIGVCVSLITFKVVSHFA